MPETTDLNLEPAVLDQISLASAYRANMNTLKEGMCNRLPQDAGDVTAAVDLLDEAILRLTVYVNRQLGQLRD